MKLSEKQWEEFCQKTGVRDTASATEEERKRDVNMRILLDYWQAVDRQWLQDHKEKLKAEKLRQKEAARIAKTKTKTPARSWPSLTLPPFKPFKFDSEKPFVVPARLNGLAKNCMKQFRF